MTDALPILVTAFEPSGDVLAARLIHKLKERNPGQRIVAMGGEAMRAAGAELLAITTEHSVMGIPSPGEIREHLSRTASLRRWLKHNPIQALIPTDSPAANWAVCKMVRKRYPEAKIVHLVAPQLWAWGSWRVKKLHKYSDHVMCMLPFEPTWFGQRGVEATFVGHPLFEADAFDAYPPTDGLPTAADGGAQLALLPGSRASELKKNWPLILRAAETLLGKHPGSVAVVACRTKADVETCQAMLQEADLPGFHPTFVHGRTDDVLSWANVAIVTSGTATLQVAAHGTPMASLYRVNEFMWNLLGKRLVQTRTFTLPNLISEHLGFGHVIPELIPFFGEPQDVVDATDPLMADGMPRRRQQDIFRQIRDTFEAQTFSEAAADAFTRVLTGSR